MGLIAIGDIHGCVHTLGKLIGAIAPRSSDRLVFLGDYVDRGPDSCGVIDKLLELAETHDCTFLRGNHDAYLLDWCETGRSEDWFLYGGWPTLQSYARPDWPPVIPQEHVEFLRRTQLYLDTPDYFLVHGGLLPDISVAQNKELGDPEVFMFCRKHLTALHLCWEKCVVFGHTPVAEPIVSEKMIAVDTGCVYPDRPGLGVLTAIRLPELQLIQVPNCEPVAPD